MYVCMYVCMYDHMIINVHTVTKRRRIIWHHHNFGRGFFRSFFFLFLVFFLLVFGLFSLGLGREKSGNYPKRKKEKKYGEHPFHPVEWKTVVLVIVSCIRMVNTLNVHKKIRKRIIVIGLLYLLNEVFFV